MQFQPNQIIQQLKANKETFKNVFAEIPDEAIHWKQTSDKWSSLIILCHLVDEEIDDFRQRTKIQLESPGTIPPSIDPVAWVKDHKYEEQNFDSKLNEFINERELSIKWLEGLKKPNWDGGYDHATFGILSAGFFLTNWLAHDYLHLKQLTRLKYDYLVQLSEHPFKYAGTWT